MSDFAIRLATVHDAAALAELAARTFFEAFAADNDPADMQAHLERAYGVAQQTRELEDPDMRTLVAECDRRLIGYTQLRRHEPPEGVEGPDPIEMQRFYVDQAWHGRGVAQALMIEAFDVARGLGARTMWLGVWEKNPRAQRFYAKMGFVDVGSQVFVVGSDPQTDRVFARPLA